MIDRRSFANLTVLVLVGALKATGKMTRARPANAAPHRTPEEQEIVDLVARRNGRKWAEEHAALILEQARAIGEL
jgi:hypothetical protein